LLTTPSHDDIGGSRRVDEGESSTGWLTTIKLVHYHDFKLEMRGLSADKERNGFVCGSINKGNEGVEGNDSTRSLPQIEHELHNIAAIGITSMDRPITYCANIRRQFWGSILCLRVVLGPSKELIYIDLCYTSTSILN